MYFVRKKDLIIIGYVVNKIVQVQIDDYCANGTRFKLVEIND